MLSLSETQALASRDRTKQSIGLAIWIFFAVTDSARMFTVAGTAEISDLMARSLLIDSCCQSDITLISALSGLPCYWDGPVKGTSDFGSA